MVAEQAAGQTRHIVVSKAVAKAMKAEAADREMSMGQLLEELWAKHKQPEKPEEKIAIKTDEVYTLEIRRQISMLVRVLKSGNERAKRAVTVNLEWMYEQVGGIPEDAEPIAIVEIDGETINRLIHIKTGTSGGSPQTPPGRHGAIRGGKTSPPKKHQ